MGARAFALECFQGRVYIPLVLYVCIPLSRPRSVLTAAAAPHSPPLFCTWESMSESPPGCWPRAGQQWAEAWLVASGSLDA